MERSTGLVTLFSYRATVLARPVAFLVATDLLSTHSDQIAFFIFTVTEITRGKGR